MSLNNTVNYDRGILFGELNKLKKRLIFAAQKLALNGLDLSFFPLRIGFQPKKNGYFIQDIFFFSSLAVYLRTF